MPAERGESEPGQSAFRRPEGDGGTVVRHIEGDPLVFTVEQDGVICLFTEDFISDPDNPGAIRRHLQQNRFYEGAFLNYIKSLRLGGTYLDVGAYIGTHSIFFAKHCEASHVIAFEPRGNCFKELVANVQLNRLESDITTHEFALSDAAGSVRVSLDGQRHDLPTRRLDDFQLRDVSLIKIDVEGMEPRVLAGARRLLLENWPVVFAEAGTDEELRSLTAVLYDFQYEATGRVFNATPTYEFVPRPRLSRLQRLTERWGGSGKSRSMRG